MSMAEVRLNLSKADVLLVQNNQTELDILGQMFIGFGVKTIRKFVALDQAEPAARTSPFDLMVVDCDFANGEAYEFVSRLRRYDEGPNRLAPILLLCGHTVPTAIARARDCGANFVVAKPITPKVMFDRISWVARDQRQFVDCDSYVGPDRRHKAYGPPPGVTGRRKDDLPEEIGEAIGPDLCQSDIDAMFNPKRAVA